MIQNPTKDIINAQRLHHSPPHPLTNSSSPRFAPGDLRIRTHTNTHNHTVHFHFSATQHNTPLSIHPIHPSYASHPMTSPSPIPRHPSLPLLFPFSETPHTPPTFHHTPQAPLALPALASKPQCSTRKLPPPILGLRRKKQGASRLARGLSAVLGKGTYAYVRLSCAGDGDEALCHGAWRGRRLHPRCRDGWAWLGLWAFLC